MNAAKLMALGKHLHLQLGKKPVIYSVYGTGHAKILYYIEHPGEIPNIIERWKPELHHRFQPDLLRRFTCWEKDQ